MAQLYALSRSGGPKSPRFSAYVARVEHEFGLVGYNPMAGPAALEAVQRLVALDAEAIALASARSVAAHCKYVGSLTLAIVVASPGMWTDRLATEVQHRTVATRTPDHGLIYQWAGDELTEYDIRRESVAEAVRTIWTSQNGPATTVRTVIEREGLAYALGGNPYGPCTSADDADVEEALSILGDSTSVADIAGVLYGDPACAAHGWPLLGIAEHAGFRYGVSRATIVE